MPFCCAFEGPFEMEARKRSSGVSLIATKGKTPRTDAAAAAAADAAAAAAWDGCCSPSAATPSTAASVTPRPLLSRCDSGLESENDAPVVGIPDLKHADPASAAAADPAGTVAGSSPGEAAEDRLRQWAPDSWRVRS